MQPNRDNQDWQQPNEQPSQAPYSAPLQTQESSLDSQQPLVQQQTLQPIVTHLPDNNMQQSPPVVMDQTSPEPVSVRDSSSSQESQPEVVATDDEGIHPAFTPVRWQANEHIDRDQNQTWYFIFGIVTVLLMVAAIVFIKSITFTILIPVMAASLVVYVRRSPHVIDYTLSRQGLHINDHLNPFSEFKAFGVIHDDDEYSILLIPTKRFKPAVSVYFPEEAGEQIVDMFGARLPMREVHLDPIDRLTRKLHI